MPTAYDDQEIRLEDQVPPCSAQVRDSVSMCDGPQRAEVDDGDSVRVCNTRNYAAAVPPGVRAVYDIGGRYDGRHIVRGSQLAKKIPERKHVRPIESSKGVPVSHFDQRSGRPGVWRNGPIQFHESGPHALLALQVAGVHPIRVLTGAVDSHGALQSVQDTSLL